jgi:hypothetical protein
MLDMFTLCRAIEELYVLAPETLYQEMPSFNRGVSV